MNRFHKMLIMLMILAIIGISIAIVANSGILGTDSVKNVVIKQKNNGTTEEIVFNGDSTGTVTFGATVSAEDLKLPQEQEEQAIDIVLDDPNVKEILDGKKYNVTKVQKVTIITTVDRTYLSENIVVVEIEVDNHLYFINVDMVKKRVQGNVVPILESMNVVPIVESMNGVPILESIDGEDVS